MPDCVRTQASNSFSRIVTKNIRSRSGRCAIDSTLIRGLPSGERNSRGIDSGSPVSHVANAGEASRLFNRIASFARSPAGMNVSRSITPTRVIGGVWINRTSDAIATD